MASREKEVHFVDNETSQLRKIEDLFAAHHGTLERAEGSNHDVCVVGFACRRVVCNCDVSKFGYFLVDFSDLL